MKTVRTLFAASLAAAVTVLGASAQPPTPKPGPEHDQLKKLEGTWDATMKAPGMESKGTMTYKMDLGGLWLVSSFEGEFAGMKFSGKGLDTYDAAKKKYVGVWADSMSTTPMLMEGDYDKSKKALTMIGDGPDGKPTKWKSVTEMPDNDNMTFHMYMGDGKEPMFTIVYKRRK